MLDYSGLEEDILEDPSGSEGAVGLDSSGLVHFLEKRMSLETARQIDEQLRLEDAAGIALFIVQTEKALKICQEYERQNSCYMMMEGRKAGILEMFWYSADKFKKKSLFERQAYEVLYLTDNKRILYNLGLEPEQAMELLDSQRSLPPYKRLLFDFCRQVIPEEQVQLTDLLLTRAYTTARYKMMETQLLDLMVRLSLDPEKCCKLLFECITELKYTHLAQYLTPHVGRIVPPAEGKEYYEKGPGLVIIINQKNFVRNDGGVALDARLGTDVDRDYLEMTFTLLGASKIIIYNDLDSKDMENKLEDCQRYVNMNGSEYKWFVLCILSHGRRTKCGKDEVFGTDGVGIDRKRIILKFACARNSPGLQNIPKIFIIQACRVMEGESQSTPSYPLHEEEEEVVVETDGGPGTENRFPVADHLVVSSAVEDFVAYRHTEHGSFFVRILCEELIRHGHSENLMSLVSQVNGRMFQIKKYPCMAEFLGTLTKKLVFQRSRDSMLKAAKLAILNMAFRDIMINFVDERSRQLIGATASTA